MEQRGDGRDLTGSPELSDGKCWANKLLQMINIGQESYLSLDLFPMFSIVLNTFSVIFLLFFRSLISFCISVSNTVVSAGPTLHS